MGIDGGQCQPLGIQVTTNKSPNLDLTLVLDCVIVNKVAQK